MSITLHQIRAFRGPNIYSPSQGVFAQFSSPLNLARPLEYALKDAAQRIGLIITRPQIEQYQQDYTLNFDTEQPVLAAEMLKTLVQTIQASGDPEFTDTDFDELLWPLKQQHRSQALHISSLQVLAEARQRHIPYFLRNNGAIQLGYGVNGQSYWPQKQYNDGLISSTSIGTKHQQNAPKINWSQLGSIPIIACSGHSEHNECARLLGQSYPQAQIALDADFESTRQILAQPNCQFAIIALNPHSLAEYGVGFAQCQHSIILDLPSHSSQQQAYELGLPLLLSSSNGFTVLNIDQTELSELIEYCPSQLVLISQNPHNPLLQQHIQQAGLALYRDQQNLIFAQNNQLKLLATHGDQALSYAQLAYRALITVLA